MSAVFAHDDEQRRLAEETAFEASKRRGKTVRTEIVPYTGFTLAEAYHQKYSLRRLETVERELEAIYPALADLVSSTAAARINAFAAGGGSREELDELAPELGLSERALEELRRVVD